MIELPRMEKERYFVAEQVKPYGFKKWTRNCSRQWDVAVTSWPFKRKHKKNDGSVLTGRKHTKIVRPGDVFISSGAPRQCAYESWGCVQKNITLYHNFFRNLNFKNIVNFFKGTCCHLNHLFIFLSSIVMFSFVWIPLWVIKGLTISQNDLLVAAPLFLISFIYSFLDCFSKLLHFFLIFL